MILDCFFNDRDNHLLWLPLFFLCGCFIAFNFCIKSYIYLPILTIAFIVFFYTKRYLLKYLSLIIIFMLLGIIRSYRHINNYKYPEITYNLGKVKVIGNISSKMLKFQDNGELTRYITIEVESIEPLNKNSKFSKDVNFKNPRFLRIKMSDNYDIIYGRAEIEANLLPIQNKDFDSSFDLQMYFYFKKIGGLGYNGKIIKYLEENTKLTIGQTLTNFREKIASRILAIKKDSLSMNLLTVIVTGQRNLANKDMLEIMNKSGLSHIMSIVGLQLLVLTSIIIFLVKRVFAFYNNAFLRYDVYKISAIISIFINSFYLLLGGLNISSTRAYLMNIITLIGILLDRFTNPLRSIMFTMFIMVFTKPDLVYRAGFYMSFLSSITIIAFMDYRYIYKYEDFINTYNCNFFRFLKMILITSIIVELAILPIEIYNFNILNFCSILANVIVNPLMTFVIIPFGLLSLLLMPFRLEKMILLPISYLIDCIIHIAKISNKVRFGMIFIQSPNIIIIVLMVFGILWLSLWSTDWRKFGTIAYLTGILMILFQRNIDIVIDNKNKMLFFVDERKNIYVYNNNNRSQNIVNKLGSDKFFDLNKSHLDTCTVNDNRYCSRIIIKDDDTIDFYKNGKLVTIYKYKGYFYAKAKIGNMKVKKTIKKSYKTNWKRCNYL